MKRFFKFEDRGVMGYVLYSEISGWEYTATSGTIYLKGGCEIDAGVEACGQLEEDFGIVDEAISEAESVAGAHQNPVHTYRTVRK